MSKLLDRPLTSLTVMPLHPKGARDYWGHDLRTRPGDQLPALDEYVVQWDWRCRGCIENAETYVAFGQDAPLWWQPAPDEERLSTLLSAMVARSRRFWADTVEEDAGE